MLIVPQQETVRLHYARTGADRLGLALSLGALVAAVAWVGLAPTPSATRRSAGGGARPAARSASRRAPGRDRPGADPAAFPPPPTRWGGVIPGPPARRPRPGAASPRRPRTARPRRSDLYARASRAYAESRFADAAEYARHAIARSAGQPLREELLCLRGESLLQGGQPGPAREAFETLLQDAPQTPYAAQALFGRARAREATGDAAGAEADRQRLRDEHPDTPWAKRLGPRGSR